MTNRNDRTQLHYRVENDFTYHPNTTDDIAVAHDVVRKLFNQVAHELVDILPISREQSLALTNLEQAMMYSNAAIARYQQGST